MKAQLFNASTLLILFNNSRLRVVISLLLMSAMCFGLVVFRVLWTHHISYLFLIWNLFLAWVPLLIAFGLHLLWPSQRRLTTILPLAFLWLLFFPNAPYLLTDVVHLRHDDFVLWFDPVMVFSFALAGLMTGLFSLYFIHELMEEVVPRMFSWLLIVCILLIAGYGIYAGRVLRLNSWELFTDTQRILWQMYKNLLQPAAFSMSIGFALLMFFLYLIIYSLIHVRTDAPRCNPSLKK